MNAPLDMRFGDEGECTAADILNEWKEEDIERIIVGSSVKNRFREQWRDALFKGGVPLLCVLLLICAMWQHCYLITYIIQIARQTFQAFRIAVNDELSILEQTLRGFIPLLESQGRIVIMSYHSL